MNIHRPTEPAPRAEGQPWPVADAAAFLRVSVRTLTDAAKAGKLRLIRMGRRVFVPDAEVRRVADQGLETAA